MNFSKTLSNQLKHDTPYAWFLRHQASSSPIFRKQHVAELDERLEAYLDCYLISERAEQSLLPDLNYDDWGSVFVTASTALRTNNADAFQVAVEAVETPQQSKELSDAFCWGDFETAKPFLEKLVSDDNALVRVAAIVSGGFFTDSLNNNIMQQCFDDESPEVIIAALKVVGDNKLHAFDSSVQRYIDYDSGENKESNEAIRFQAAYSACLLALPNAITALQKFCFNETPYLREALALLYQVVPESDIESALTKIQKSQLSPRIKAYNIAMSGLPNLIPVLLEWMKDPEYAPLAGEAFSFITGVDIEEDDLSIMHVEPCESDEIPLAEKRKQDPWTSYYEDDLPWPDPELVEPWWQVNQHRFQNGTRYLAGHILENENLQQILEHGTQPQRHLANLMLAVKTPKARLRTIR